MMPPPPLLHLAAGAAGPPLPLHSAPHTLNVLLNLLLPLRWLWPLYWVAQGTMFWALFVLGHDCGHGKCSALLYR